jgi:hypothetical protein
MKKLIGLASLAMILTLSGCDKDKTEAEPYLIFKFKFDPNQERLDNFGNPSVIPANHGTQSPNFKYMAAHYLEMAQDRYTQIGDGTVLYHAEETTLGGSTAIVFEKEVLAKNDSVFLKIPLKDVKAGSYEWLRVSLAYQNYEVNFLLDTSVNVGGTLYPIKQEFPCQVASFVGYNTYIKSYNLRSQTVTVNANKPQGYWGSEAYGTIFGQAFSQVNTGQAPAGSTTVVNPIEATSPIPRLLNSCLATGQFEGGNLVITGKETKDVVVTVSLSVNKSFEWLEVVNDGKWEPLKGENVVDMGIRGLKALH